MSKQFGNDKRCLYGKEVLFFRSYEGGIFLLQTCEEKEYLL